MEKPVFTPLGRYVGDYAGKDPDVVFYSSRADCVNYKSCYHVIHTPNCTSEKPYSCTHSNTCQYKIQCSEGSNIFKCLNDFDGFGDW